MSGGIETSMKACAKASLTAWCIAESGAGAPRERVV